MVRSELWRHVISGLISLTLLAGGIGGFFLLVYKPQAPAAEPKAALPPLVRAVPIELHSGSLDISTDGTVVPFREISISAEVVGRVMFKAEQCRAGNFVSKGTLLLEIDPRDYDFEIQRLTTQLSEATAAIEELEVEISSSSELIALSNEDLALQQRELARVTNIAGGVVTESDLDRSKQAELKARNALAVLKHQDLLQKTRRNRLQASRKLVETQLEKAELDLARTKVVAPTDGVIVEDMVEAGDYVQRAASLVTIEETSAVEVKCNLQMDELYWLWRSQSQQVATTPGASRPYDIPKTPVTVVYELPQSGIRYEWSGRLSRFESIGLDEKTRTVPCRVLVDNPRDVRTSPAVETAYVGPPALVRGMYVIVEIHVATKDDLVRIPERAVHPGKSIWLARDGHLKVIKPVRLIELIELATPEGETTQYWIADAVASKVTPGDLVIVSPLAVMTNEMPIRLEEKP